MKRKASLKRGLPALGVDAFLVTDLRNIRYLTGFTGTSAFMIITGRQSLFFTDFRYQEQAKIEVQGSSIKIERAERPDTIKEVVERHGIKKLGFESHHVSYQMYRKLLRKGIKLKALTDTVEGMRLQRTPDEFTFIKTAIQRAENAFRKLQPYIRVGTSEQKLAIKFEDLLKKEGCKTVPFGVIVASGPSSALPHAQPTSRIIKKGDIVLFDWGGECNGYYSDITRAVAIEGRHLKKQLKLFSVVREAQNRAIQTVQSGARAADIDGAARGFIRKQGYDRYFGHSTGHGIGLDVHEKPVISWQNKKAVKNSMVFTIEPGIYLPGFGGIRIEDIVAVRKDRAEVLTTLPRTLKVMKG
ncbi:aminopeptidase P family protein [bacterium]|nr:MAG: aminopeptidase P family protein [bacterium]